MNLPNNNLSSTDSFKKELLNKLIQASSKQRSNLNQNDLVEYFLKMLNSQLSTLSSNEGSIVSSINDMLSPDKRPTFQILYAKLSKMKNKLKNRWAFFYFIMQFANLMRDNKSTEEQGFITSVYSRYMMSNDLLTTDSKNAKMGLERKENNLSNNYFFKNDIEISMNPINSIEDKIHSNKHYAAAPEENDRASTRMVVNKFKYSKVITEKDLINDLIYVFQGIDGNYINYSSSKDCYQLNPIIPFNDSIIDIVSSLCELGWLFRKTKSLVEQFIAYNSYSQILQAFIYAVKEELNYHYKVISLFKHSNSVEKDSKETDELTLKRLILWTIEPIEKMKWLAIACEACQSLRGIHIVSQIYSYVKYSYAFHLKRVLFTTAQPMFTMIKNWVVYGELNDAAADFFVRIHSVNDEDQIWVKKYELKYSHIPNFSDIDFYEKIFIIGKTIHFIRHFCDMPQFSLNHENMKDRLIIEEEVFEKVYYANETVESEKKELNLGMSSSKDNISNELQKMDIDHDLDSRHTINNLKAKAIGKDDKKKEIRHIVKKPIKLIFSADRLDCLTDIPDLKREIDVIQKEVSKFLVELLWNKFYLKDHLKSINNYMLLGQGDMIQYLMELLFEDLDKSAVQIQKHHLRGKLDSAITSSNAKYSKFNHNLEVCLKEASCGDVGWNIFMLDYKVSLPLTLIFTKASMTEYQRLFVFFWHLKKMEFTNNYFIWKKFMIQSHYQRSQFENLRYLINQALLFNQQTIHFISTFHNYITLEVLETQTKRLNSKLKTVQSIDELISLHEEFISKVVEQSLLNKENHPVYSMIISIFNDIADFRLITSSLTENFQSYYIRIEELKRDNIGNEYYQNNDNDVYLSQFLNNITAFTNRLRPMFERFKLRISELIKALEVVGKGNFKYLAMKLDYNGYYSDLDTRMFNSNNYNPRNDYDNDESMGGHYPIENEMDNQLMHADASKKDKYFNNQMSLDEPSYNNYSIENQDKLEVDFNKNSYVYESPRKDDEIENDLNSNLNKILNEFSESKIKNDDPNKFTNSRSKFIVENNNYDPDLFAEGQPQPDLSIEDYPLKKSQETTSAVQGGQKISGIKIARGSKLKSKIVQDNQ